MSRRGRFSVAIAVLAGAVSVVCGCSDSGDGKGRSTLITSTSLGGVHLGESRDDVASALGTGRLIGGSGTDATVRYPKAGLTVFFGEGRAYFVRTHDRRYRTRGGIGVGSTIARVATLPGIGCFAPQGKGTCESRKNSGVPGLDFTIAEGHVTEVSLVVRQT
ncbi:MAG: hypothetical protein ACRDQC_03900 [Gaiellales bacterium]